MDDLTSTLPAFMHCDTCRKVHIVTLVSEITVCACGRNLFEQIWPGALDTPHTVCV